MAKHVADMCQTPAHGYLGHMKQPENLKRGHNTSGALPPLGSGERFAKLERSIAAKGKVRDPAAVAAAIGRRKYGTKRFQKLAAAGK